MQLAPVASFRCGNPTVRRRCCLLIGLLICCDLFTLTDKIIHGYGEILNPLTRGYTVELSSNISDHKYVKLEDLQDVFDITCSTPAGPGSNLTHIQVQFHRYADFVKARELWDIDEVIYSVHDPTCDGLKARSFYRPLSQHFDDAARVLSLDAQDLHIGAETFGSKLMLISGDFPAEVRDTLSLRFKDQWMRVLEELGSSQTRNEHRNGKRDGQAVQQAHTEQGLWGAIKDFGHGVRDLKDGFVHGVKDCLNPFDQDNCDETKQDFHDAKEHAENTIEEIKDTGRHIVDTAKKIGEGVVDIAKACLPRDGEPCFETIKGKLEGLVEHMLSHELNINFHIPIQQPRHTLIGSSAVNAHLQVDCKDCKMQAGIRARSIVDLDVHLLGMVQDLLQFDIGDARRDIFDQAKIEIEVTDEVDLAFQLEISSDAGMQGYCWWVPEVEFKCGANYGLVEGVEFGNEHKWTATGQNAKQMKTGDYQRASRSDIYRPVNKKFGEQEAEVGLLKFTAFKVDLGLFAAVSIKSQLNFTTPGFEVKVPAGQTMVLDLLNNNDHIQSSIKPDFTLRSGHLELSQGSLQFTLAERLKAKAEFHMVGFEKKPLLAFDATLEMARYDLEFSEDSGSAIEGSQCQAVAARGKDDPRNGDETVFKIMLNYVFGLNFKLEIGEHFQIRSAMSEIGSKLIQKIPVVEWCWTCNGRCPSKVISDWLESVPTLRGNSKAYNIYMMQDKPHNTCPFSDQVKENDFMHFNEHLSGEGNSDGTRFVGQ